MEETALGVQFTYRFAGYKERKLLVKISFTPYLLIRNRTRISVDSLYSAFSFSMSNKSKC